MPGFSPYALCGQHLQKLARVALENRRAVLVADRRGLQPRGAERIVDVGPVDREHDALDAHLGDRAGQRRVRERAAGGESEVRLVIVAERLRQFQNLLQIVFGPPQRERRGFAEMPDDDLQVRIFVEQA